MSGDILYRQSTQLPYQIIRNGWGDYAGHVRLARFDEKLSDWTSGHWVRCSDITKLDVQDVIITVRAIRRAFDDVYS